jgi:hypothetical protein
MLVSQARVRFQFALLWSTNLRSRSQAEIVHRRLVLNSEQSDGGPPAGTPSYAWQAKRTGDPPATSIVDTLRNYDIVL